MNVFPQQFYFDPTRGEHGQYLSGADVGMGEGLTKRELFAAMAMQGILGTDFSGPTFRDIADEAVTYADALIAALSTEPTS